MNRKAEFFACVIPSVLAFTFSGIYAIADGFFIGNCIGDNGLAAINIAWPVTALLQAVGTGIGMGGAVRYSLCSGEENRAEMQKHCFSVTVALLFASSLAVTLLLYLSMSGLLILFGAEGELLSLGEEYLRVIIPCALFQIFGTGFVPLIRNMGGALTAMTAMILGFLTNILLDYLLVWILHYGLSGAAAATVSGQAVTMAVGVVFFIKKKTGFAPPAPAQLRTWSGKILKVALSPFGLTFSPNIVLIMMNKAAMLCGGSQAVACYAAVAYITMIVLLLLQGVGDGCQPLISRYYGIRAFRNLKETRRLAYLTAGILAFLCMILLFLIRNRAAALFGASPDVQAETGQALPFFLAGFPFLAFIRVTTSVFYACSRNKGAYLLVYAEPLLLLLLLLILAPQQSVNGIWLAVPLSQALTAVLAAAVRICPSKQISSDPPGSAAV